LRTKVFSAIDVKENPKLINSFIRRLSANPNVSSISQVKEKFSGVRVRWLERVWTGARFLGIHLTANYEFGSDELMNQYYYFLCSQRMGKGGLSDETGYYDKGAGSAYIYRKVYPKIQEVLKRKTSTESIINYFTGRGLIRFEMELFPKFLKPHGLYYLGDVLSSQGLRVLRGIFMTESSKELRVHELPSIQNEYSGLSMKAFNVFEKWRAHPSVPIQPMLVPKFMSRATFYRFAREIREKTGYDIKLAPPQHVINNIRHLTVTAHLTPVISVPSVYKLPKIV
jgi:hypothetical protein